MTEKRKAKSEDDVKLLARVLKRRREKKEKKSQAGA